ncbi:hypothetical protein QYF36_020932 [Acer negundo]|nr:hypothetical protein QYF36_020932 [Acer negundo]
MRQSIRVLWPQYHSLDYMCAGVGNVHFLTKSCARCTPTNIFKWKQHSVEASAIAIEGDQREDFDDTSDQREDFDSTSDNREDFDGSRTTPATRPTVLVNHDLRW